MDVLWIQDVSIRIYTGSNPMLLNLLDPKKRKELCGTLHEKLMKILFHSHTQQEFV